jgi:hypothetical protein
VGGVLLDPVYPLDWRLARQDYADSYWRLRRADLPKLSATVNVSPPRINLSFYLPTNSATLGISLRRRVSGATNWSALVISNQFVTNYTDSAVTVGTIYEYEFYREVAQYTPRPEPRYYLTSAVQGAPIEDRGRVILVTDKTFTNDLATHLAILQNDLVGDGWEVARLDADRHNDTTWSANTNAIRLLRGSISNLYSQAPARTKALILVGHVVVPSSGEYAPDGHYNCVTNPLNSPNHQGAWSADTFYGDVDGTWTDATVNYSNCDNHLCDNYPGDGKFDTDLLTTNSLGQAIEMAVGRIDFAKLPALGVNPPVGSTPDPKEVDLLRRYIDKAHRYRFKGLFWQTNGTDFARVATLDRIQEQNIGLFKTMGTYVGAAANGTALFGAGEDRVGVGNPILEGIRVYQFAFETAPGQIDRINDAVDQLQVTAGDLASAAVRPAAFYSICASYMGDWNLLANNFVRSLIAASTDYGLAATWFSASTVWRFHPMAMGLDLGAAMRQLMNNSSPAAYGYQDRGRHLSVVGDPTLRLNATSAPLGLTGYSSAGTAYLSWSSGESGCAFNVYRASSVSGPFTNRLNASPVAGSPFSAPSHIPGMVYGVRALKSVSTGSGSYTNISQAAFVTVN